MVIRAGHNKSRFLKGVDMVDNHSSAMAGLTTVKALSSTCQFKVLLSCMVALVIIKGWLYPCSSRGMEVHAAASH